jgi:hypothetical protein
MQKHNSQYYLICIFESLFTTAIQNVLTNMSLGIFLMKCMKHYIFGIIFLLSWQNANSQGFDWIKSWRLPSDSPDMFIGGYTGFGMNTEYVDARSFSDVLECCQFKDGSGYDFRIGLTGEYWLMGDVSLQAQIGFGSTNASFNANRQDSILIIDRTTEKARTEILLREYTLTSRIQSFELAMIAKKRLFASHFSVALGFLGAITLPNDSMHELEMKVSVPGMQLDRENYTPNEMVKGIEVSGFIFKPIIRCEYDLSIFNDIYIKPYIQTDITLNSRVTREDPWRSLTVLGGFSILFSY